MSVLETAVTGIETDKPASPGEAPVALSRERLLHRLASSAAPRGMRIACELLGSRAEAEDAVQEALVKACEACERIRDPGAADGWFFRVLTNVCLRTLRRRRRRRLFLGRSAVSEPDEGAGEPVVPVATELRADRALARQQDVAALLRALSGLPDKQRVALLLRYGHDMSVAEVASMLDVSPATAKTHLVRGLRRLRKTMERLS